MLESDAKPAKPRVLFVDDEAPVLLALARLMRALRDDIESVFVSSAKETLVLLAQSKFDVVVADVRMPDMDGAALLTEVQRSYPHIFRVVLSGHADLGAAVRSVSVAQQFLAKPCDAATLRSVITRGIRLHRLLKGRALQSLVAGMQDIPATPSMFTELCQLLVGPGTLARDIAQRVSSDAALSGAVVQVANLALRGSQPRVISLESAVSCLGANKLRAVILATAATTQLGPRAQRHGYDWELDTLHARLCACLAASMFSDRRISDDAFAAALLHNVGELLLLAEGAEANLRALAHAKQRGARLADAERELGSVPHAHVGAYLLESWGLTYSIVESVAYHHAPEQVPHTTFDLVDAVYVSALVADHCVEHAPNALERAAAHLAQYASAPRLVDLIKVAERTLSDPACAWVSPRAADALLRPPENTL